MVRVFITVGTTAFDSLLIEIDNIDLASIFGSCEVTSQISNEGTYIPKNSRSYRYSTGFHEDVENADYVITHAGAGNVYSLLERGKSILVVPNLERFDKHQVEIANYVEKHNYALVCNNVNKLKDSLESLIEFVPEKYENLNSFNFDRFKRLL